MNILFIVKSTDTENVTDVIRMTSAFLMEEGTSVKIWFLGASLRSAEVRELITDHIYDLLEAGAEVYVCKSKAIPFKEDLPSGLKHSTINYLTYLITDWATPGSGHVITI
ncbi:MAG: hypothetical protein H0Z39_03375 [Peptococcaceae bacterium]|nr:hypothetical protein [Peptococcaceae bacterium]